MNPNAGVGNNPIAVVIGLIFVCLLAGSIAVWFWIISRKLRLLPLMPTEARLPARWGIGTLVAAGLVWFLCQIAVARFVSPAQNRADVPPPPAAATAAGTEKEPAEGEVKIEPTPVAPVFSSQTSITVVAWAGLLFLGVLPVSLWLTGRHSLQDLGLHSRGMFKNLFRGIATCLAIAPLCYGMMFVVSFLWPPNKHPLQEMLQNTLTSDVVFLALLSAVVIAPLTEEIFFRGLMLPWLARLFDPTGQPGSQEPLLSGPESSVRVDSPTELESESLVAESLPLSDPTPLPTRATRTLPFAWALPNIVTSIIFAGLHGAQWPAPLPLLVLSLTLGWLAQRTGSLWGPIGLHATFNGISTGMLLLVQAGGPGPDKQPESPKAPKPKARTSITQCSLAGCSARLDQHFANPGGFPLVRIDLRIMIPEVSKRG